MENIKIKLKLVSERINNFLINTNKTGKDKRTEPFLKARIQLLENYWSQYLRIYDELCDGSTVEQFEDDEHFKSDRFDNIECSYVEALSELNVQLDAFSIAKVDSVVQSLPNSPNMSSVRQSIKLPKITLPVFNGSYQDWPSFRDTYVSLIHDNSALDNVQKMHYLKSAVTGEASKLLQHMSLTSADYFTAWEILSSRYNNTRILVNANLAALFTLSSMATESASELQRVLDNFNQAVRAIENLKRPVQYWGDFLVYLLSNKLDCTTRKDWETSLNSSTEIPSFESLTTFLEGRLHTLDAIKGNNSSDKRFTSGHRTPRSTLRSHHTLSSKNCPNCEGKHILLFCPQFRSTTIEERITFLQKKKLCTNCLKPHHTSSTCPSINRCKYCNKKHHSMIHKFNTQLDIKGNSSNTKSQCSSTVTDQPTSSTSAHMSNHYNKRTSILLATAIVFVTSTDNRTIRARALLDQGSESSFITASLANLLRLPKKRANISVLGVGNCEAGVAKACVIHDIISTVDTKCKYTVESLVLPTLTKLVPAKQVVKANWPHLKGLTLADPEYDIPENIDLILGADIYARVIQGEIRRGCAGSPIAQLTSLGWILSGSVNSPSAQTTSISNFHSSITDLDALLRRFWEIEEPPKVSILTPEEEECELSFNSSHYRNSQGRYVVRLPYKLPIESLGQSRGAALAALLRMEKRFSQDSNMFNSYSTFIQEYLQLKHMEPVYNENENFKKCYYLPHHAVMKPSSTTTKLRVVFNASQKTSSGISLNDILHVGPKLQNDVFLVILRWRLYPFIYSADMEKMYRQILVDKADVDCQRILWRNSPSEQVQCFRLLTVTYGTASAPYLACRTLQQLADDYCHDYPEAANVLKRNVYVDDALFGAFDKQSALRLRDDLRHLLELAGFNLRKWITNMPELLVDIPEEDQELRNITKLIGDAQIKALGINFDPLNDKFRFKINLPRATLITKRSILSDISRLYDPLGWLSPITITSKILLQKLWIMKLGWDEELPPDVKDAWIKFKQDLDHVQDLSLDRWMGTTSASHVGLELHGFCDASLSAYGAVVYLRIIHNHQTIQVSLLAAKTRVSPIKTISLPRLELCGAALLAELLHYIQQNLNFTDVPVHAWTDSTIVLAWLSEHPSKWKVYVANRVSLIHDKIPSAMWHHVNSSQNPADCITRGLTAKDLKNFKLWWSGPTWLQQHSTNWPHTYATPPSTLLKEDMRPVTAFVIQKQEHEFELLRRYSCFLKLLRITAFCYRFYNNCKLPEARRVFGTLTTEDLNSALTKWIIMVQQSHFNIEIIRISNKKPVPSSSKILNLHPFLDEHQIMRVGGRLKHSLLNYEEKFPIILPKESYFTHLIINHAHTSTLHGGVQHTLHYIRSKYWILSGRSKVRQIIRNCIICCRYKAKTKSQLMGDLPPERIRPAKPFFNIGVDYAGPFNVKPVKGRGHKILKSYVAVFICMVTRAIHLELVMDLSTDAFLAAFKRFVSRRGRCCRLISDNATCFTGADKLLSLHFQQLKNDPAIAQFILKDGTEWQFIPPSAPHFGGIWEAGVKSFKHHIRRVVGDHTLSIEEMLTLIAQVEACLNSRPLHALNDDPDDISALTPGHFLVGESLITVPAPSILSTPAHHLNRWDLTQHMYEDIWKRWYKDYIHHLQLRNKWCQKQESIKINDLVLIKDDRLPPSKWLLGRVTNVHPGTDGMIRVVTVKHKDGFYKRPIAKLCVLPLSTHEPM